MTDPLTDVVLLLDPSADFSKLVEASGPWRVRRAEEGRPFFCVVLSGACRVAADGAPAVDLAQGDFLMIPAVQQFTMSAGDGDPDSLIDMESVRGADGRYRLGPPDQPVSARLLIGYCRFGSPDAALLVSLLPRLIHVRQQARLTALVKLVADETLAQRPGREVIVARLLEVMLIEALRDMPGKAAPPGLVRGLADSRLSIAIHRMHEDPAVAWTTDDLAKAAGLSRTVFFERFRRAVGLSPMEHLTQWRMALAKRMLIAARPMAEVAQAVGYGSTSAFATAFRRTVGETPARFALTARAATAA